MKSSLIKKLIQQWCVDKGRYGLTIPFLVGAEKEFGDVKEYNFEVLFKDLSNADTKYLISYCNDLKEYVIGLPKSESPPLNMLKHFGSIYINASELEDSKSLESLKDHIKDPYLNLIHQERYSKNMDTEKWGSFDQQEIVDLKNLTALHLD